MDTQITIASKKIKIKAKKNQWKANVEQNRVFRFSVIYTKSIKINIRTYEIDPNVIAKPLP